MLLSIRRGCFCCCSAGGVVVIVVQPAELLLLLFSSRRDLLFSRRLLLLFQPAVVVGWFSRRGLFLVPWFRPTGVCWWLVGPRPAGGWLVGLQAGGWLVGCSKPEAGVCPGLGWFQVRSLGLALCGHVPLVVPWEGPAKTGCFHVRPWVTELGLALGFGPGLAPSLPWNGSGG